MTLTEVQRLLSFISAVSPSQRITNDTPNAWLVLLHDVDYDPAYRAAQRIAKRSTYVNVADIVAEVRAFKGIPHADEWGACPEHPGEWLAHCGRCRSERIAREEPVDV